MNTRNVAMLAIMSLVFLVACLSEPRHEFRPISESPYASLMPKCDGRPEAAMGQFTIINPKVPFNLTRSYGVDSVTSTLKLCDGFGLVIEEFESTEIAEQYLDGRREEIGFDEYEDVVRALDWPANWNYVVSVDPWNYTEDGAVSVSEFAVVEIVVQIGKVTLEYSEYIAHDLFEVKKQTFISGLKAFHEKASELIRSLESSI